MVSIPNRWHSMATSFPSSPEPNNTIECQRLGIETIAVDRYPDAPAMQVAHRSHVINMPRGAARCLIKS
jgi:formate-dependent phosphoribosylglycinamide formyltransferase (GAR transformylase)